MVPPGVVIGCICCCWGARTAPPGPMGMPGGGVDLEIRKRIDNIVHLFRKTQSNKAKSKAHVSFNTQCWSKVTF